MALREQPHDVLRALRLGVQQTHQQVERQVGPPSDVVQASVPTLQVVVGSDLLLVHGEHLWWPQQADDPRRLRVP